ncbi:MAG: ral secretion pathway protein [Myxococcaceae bacterium]|nr:ral secretion pathway protein [Myxococcaceae bacterium]
MSALTSLLVRDRVVSVSKIEEALHSQVFLGGDIEIILLEMGVVAEDVLSAYRAALFDLLPATREEVMKARDALRRVPAEMARSLGIVPIFFEGRSLVVAAWEPLYEPRLREVEAQLGWEVSVRIVNQARLAAALAHHYGFELEPRMRRLSDALRRRDPGVVPYVRPPTDSVRPIPRTASAEDETDEDSGSHKLATSIPPLPLPPSVPAMEVTSAAELPRSAGGRTELDELAADPLPAQQPAARDVAEPELASSLDHAYASATVERDAGSEERGSEASELQARELASTDSAHDQAPSVHDSAELVAVELPEEDDAIPPGVSTQLASLVRGPIPLARAVELLQVTSQRDDVLFVLLRYVQQFFDFVCVFSVSKEGVRARMAHGAGLPRDLVEQVFVASPGTGLLADAIRARRPQLGQLGEALEERAAAGMLHREPGRLGLVVPLDINQRVVLLIYADRVGAGLTLEHAEAVQALVPAVSAALRRIIIEAKTLRASLPPPEPAAVVQAREPEAPVPEPGLPTSVSDARTALVERAAAHLRESDASDAAAAGAATLHDQASPAPGQVDWQSEVLAEVGPSDELEADAELDAIQLGAVGRAPQRELDAELDAASLAYDAETEAALADFEAAARNDLRDGLNEAESTELSAVDLDAFERLIREDVSSDLHLIGTGAATRDPVRDRSDNALVRERIAGVPRSAPPPPRYEPAQPPAVTNGYRYRGSAGLAQERLRVEIAAAASLPLPDSVAVPSSERKADDSTADRQRLSLVEPAVNEPSVIIDMGESVDALVEALLHAAPNSEPREIDELVQIGESALPVLMQHFPGPLWFDRSRPHRRRPRGRDVSAVARAVTAFGDRAAPYLASVLAGGDPDKSYYALLVAGEIVHADLLDPVARRVLDRDESLRTLALEVLRSYAVLPQYDVVVRAISDLTERPGKDPRRQRLAVEALGALRDARTLRALLARLSDRDEQVVHAAHDALVVLTGQDFGFNSRKWDTWVEGWGRAHRVEWLIESLLHNDESVRSTAGEELKLLTQQYFGYHPSLPKRERELAQRKYREWWELEGRLNFGR